MERGAMPEWVELIDLRPGAFDCQAYCLEPGEVISISLRSDEPVDAALVDWDTYLQWQDHGDGGMPASSRFANGTASIEWKGSSTIPPYAQILVVYNPGERNALVVIEGGSLTGCPEGSIGYGAGSAEPA